MNLKATAMDVKTAVGVLRRTFHQVGRMKNWLFDK
jgi:hypothetical protein